MAKIRDFLRGIFFSDECSFSMWATVNKYRSRICDIQSPDSVRESLGTTRSLMVC